MKTLVVYDSFFGNTERIAQTIGAALGAAGETTVLRVGEVRPEHLAGVELLCIGSPTRGFRPSPATKAWLKSLPADGLRGVHVAAFDTRIDAGDVDSRVLPTMIKLFGYAAEPIAARLMKKGGTQVLPPEGFYVTGTEGPLKEGELERANTWAHQMSEACAMA
jgi:flavodoxin